MAGFFVNAIGAIASAASAGIDIKGAIAKNNDNGAATVQIIVGFTNSTYDKTSQGLGGNTPHVALWDDHGNRLGQFNPKSKDKMNENQSRIFSIPYTQNKDPNADPSYVMLSNFDNDAICVTAVSVGNDKTSDTFYGDTGYACGQSWYPSDNTLGNGSIKPKCVWLDADHSNKINARALSFHMRDMANDQAKMDEYNQNLDTLCKSTPRFSFWGNLLPDGIIPFFDPPLEYRTDGTPSEHGQPSGVGADMDLSRVLDKPNQYNKAVYLHQGEKLPKRSRIARRSDKSSGWNHDPSHLIITNHPQDDVIHLCGHDNSYGFDMASTVQNKYCEMEAKQVYDFCNGKDITNDCFDMKSKTIVPHPTIQARDDLMSLFPTKNYATHDVWGA